MKKITILFTVFMGLLLASCGGGKVENTPEAVTKAFLAKIQKGDFSGAKKYATKESATALDGMESMMDMAKSMGGGSKNSEMDKMKNSKMEVGTATINGDEATIPVTTDGKAKTMNLKKEDGAWKVAFSKGSMGKDGMNEGLDKGSKTIDNIENMGDTLKESMEKLKESLEKIKDSN